MERVVEVHRCEVLVVLVEDDDDVGLADVAVQAIPIAATAGFRLKSKLVDVAVTVVNSAYNTVPVLEVADVFVFYHSIEMIVNVFPAGQFIALVQVGHRVLVTGLFPPKFKLLVGQRLHFPPHFNLRRIFPFFDDRRRFELFVLLHYRER